MKATVTPPLARDLPATGILVVDDESQMRIALQSAFAQRGWRVDLAGGSAEALAKFRRRPYSLVVTDVRMPDGDGLAVMRQVREWVPSTAVILLTAFGSVPAAVAAMKDGACDYLLKPVCFENLDRMARQLLAQGQAKEAETPGLVGSSFAFRAAVEHARRLAGCDGDVLIQAESGTGKELVARMIHRLSRRCQAAMVAVNCAAFPEALLESELFGYAKGAFTGALAAKPGKLELAHRGTLLLDEVGDMPLALQPKLLRALQEREFDRLGDLQPVKVDLRVIATTNRPLESMVKAGQFRADLYYRLNVLPLVLPPLRQRGKDVIELAEHFARQYAAPGKPPKLTAEFLLRLERHSWPGNVRELANLMQRAVVLSGETVGADALDPPPWQESPPLEAVPDAASGASDNLRAGASLASIEKRLLELTLTATGGNRSRTAEMLGVSLRTVRNKIRCYGLPPRRSLCP